MKDILLTTINAKWIHPSLALRLLKANLAALENRCEIIEFALRQPLAEKLDGITAFCPHILGISVSIWNHTAALELLEELEKKRAEHSKLRCGGGQRPVVVLGGPEVSHLPQDAEIFKYADHVIRGEGEEVFRVLCEKILAGERGIAKFISAQNVNVSGIKSAYHLYTEEDIAKKLIYAEASRDCPFNCEFCLSAVKEGKETRKFPLEQFLPEMSILIERGVKTFKFLDRSFNVNIKRAVRIMKFFLEKIEEREDQGLPVPVVHFEMVPSLFPGELREILTRFPAGTLRLEIGIQTLNSEVSARIGRVSNPEKELEALRFLVENTNAIVHADLIAGLPGEDIVSFGEGFDKLWRQSPAEIQLGILKLLPGAPISRHNETFGMRYNPLPPYEIEETAAMSAEDISRIKNFARFWEVIINRGLVNDISSSKNIFTNFLTLSDSLYAHFGRNWGIDKAELLKEIQNLSLLQ